MEEKRVQELAAKAVKVRRTALEAIEAAHSGHVGGSFSVADILTVLYWEKMNINPEQPKDPDRDRFVLSKGHCTPTMYATLALRGFFPVEENIQKCRQLSLRTRRDDKGTWCRYVSRFPWTGLIRSNRNGSVRKSG